MRHPNTMPSKLIRRSVRMDYQGFVKDSQAVSAFLQRPLSDLALLTDSLTGIHSALASCSLECPAQRNSIGSFPLCKIIPKATPCSIVSDFFHSISNSSSSLLLCGNIF